MRRRQQGMTLIGMLCVLAMAGSLLYAGIVITPLYLNYLKVVRSMQAAAADFKGTDTVDQVAVRRSLEKHWQIEDIDSVDYKDVEITKDDSGTSLHVAYDASASYVANLSLTLHFDKTVKAQ
jgi:type II secretory pathway pseudopilin PulG